MQQSSGVSFAQQRMLFLEQYWPGTGVNNIACAWGLDGALNEAVLALSLNDVVSRHEALRTTFVLGREPAHDIAPELDIPLPSVTVSDECALWDMLTEHAERPFDFEGGPLLRAVLVRQGPTTHVLALTIHHIIADGWSIDVLLREIGQFYAARMNGEVPSLPHLSVSYADHVAWQHPWMQSDKLQEQLAFWTSKLQGAPQMLQLPSDRSRPPMRSQRGDTVGLDISVELASSLRAFCARHRMSLFTTLAAAFNVLLYRYSGEKDICMGYPVAGRTRQEVEPLIGLFVNTLVLRTRMNPEMRFLDVMRQVRDQVLMGDAHQDLPFEKLVEALQPERSLNHSPIFQVMMAMNNTSWKPLEWPGLSLRRMPPRRVSAKFDLTLNLTDTRDHLWGTLNYDTDLFDQSTVRRMGDNFVALLGLIIAKPEAKLGELSLLTVGERERLLVEWNGTHRDVPQECLHELFERRVELHPEAVAVVCGEQRLSYAQLNCKANQLAHALRDMGVRPDTLVALCVERSLDMLVGLLGILKAGGAYVPLDPDAPQERLRHILVETRAEIVITHSVLRARLPHLDGVNVWLLDAMGLPYGTQALNNPDPIACGSNLAYCIFTSGSTGKPKGVLIEHSAVVNYTMSAIARLQIEPGCAFAVCSPFFADLGNTTLFIALLQGGVLHLMVEDAHLEQAAFSSFIQENEVDFLKITPTHFLGLSGDGDISDLLPRKRLVFGGAPLPESLVERIFSSRSTADLRLFNHYGPTESTIGVLTCSLNNELTEDRNVPCAFKTAQSRSIPLGRPIHNVQAYVLDSELSLLPSGCAGELYLCGAGLARGYLNHSDLTAERFLPNPFGAPGSRMYKTGDKVRQLADGSIEFLGRCDDQVKVRGYRIEPAEIEDALRSIEGVRDAAVIAAKDAVGDDRLVGYVVPRGDGPFSFGRVQEHLKGKLPLYLIPTAWVQVEKLPLTPNGKLDRHALPEPATWSDVGGVAPRTATESMLAMMWAEVLKLERIGIHDHFFQIGGHSLLATRLLSRIRQTLDTQFSLRELFAFPTIAGQAERIGLHRRGGPTLSRIQSVARTGEPSAASWAQQRLWFLDQYLPEPSTYNMSMAWRLDGQLDPAVLERALQEIVRRHEVLRTSFVAGPSGPLQRVSDVGDFALAICDLAYESSALEKLVAMMRQEAFTHFDLQCGPLIRATLFTGLPEGQVLMLVVHHVAADGWSIGVLIQELEALYKAYESGGASPLPELPIQYIDFATWQRRLFESGAFARQSAYWEAKLEGAPHSLDLPTDKPRPLIPCSGGDVVDLPFDDSDRERLMRFCQAHQATAFMVMASVFQVLLHRFSGQNDVCIGYPIANRNRSDVEGLIGLFVNTLVLRSRFYPGQRFVELFEEVKESLLEADAHQDMPFEKLVDQLRPERKPNQTPLFQVMLSMRDASNDLSRLCGLPAYALPIRVNTAKFDLTLHVSVGERCLHGTFEYSTHLFEPSTMQALAENLVVLFRSSMAEPQKLVSKLPLLTPAQEYRQLHELHELHELHDAHRPYQPVDFAHGQFERQVALHPDAVALRYGQETLTYSQLNAQANQLAHLLRARGTKPDSLIGICLDRTPRMVVAILAVLKAGGAYLPLDPDYPAQRLRYMLKDAQALMLLTEQALLRKLPESSTPAIFLDTDRFLIDAHPQHNPEAMVLPGNLAYCIYTSGSTGNPKGVMIDHAGLMLYLDGALQLYRPCPSATVSSSLSFDATITSIYLPLLQGGVLTLLPSGEEVSALDRLLRDEGSDLIKITPTFLDVLGQGIDVGEARGEALFVVGGEALRRHTVRRWRALMPGCRIVNEYGPTETVVGCIAHSVTDADEEGVGEVPIGQPMLHRRIRILDEALQLLPAGAVGEIHIAGDGLARGYLHQPDVTAQKFVPDPYGRPGDRMYRTGDKGRWRPDGTIEFLGRADRQVKIRGVRIELGEIEAAVREAGGVDDVLVLIKGETSASHRLAAFIVPHRAQPIVLDSLMHAVRQRLPKHLVPSEWNVVDELPTTPNGKLDLAKLHSLAGQAGTVTGQPLSSMEELVAWAWKNVLGLEKAGIYDNFFDVGGNSLTLLMLRNALSERVGYSVDLIGIFRSPTVSGIANLLAKGERESSDSPVRQRAPNSVSSGRVARLRAKRTRQVG